MSFKIKEIFSEQWLAKHTRVKPTGIYEIRCSIDGVALSGAGKTIETAAENFLKRLTSLDALSKENAAKSRMTFDEFATEWLRVVKQPTVKPNTYQMYLDLYGLHIKPYFKSEQLNAITAMRIQPLFTKLSGAGKMRTVQAVKVLLNQIFNAALGERLIEINPMDGVRVLRHSNKKGSALSLADEKRFLIRCEGHAYKLAFMFLLYGGMRRGELNSVKIEDGMLIIKDGKKRLDEIQTVRRVPVTPMLARCLSEVSATEIKRALCSNVEMLTRHFKELCPEHHLHELRHTFITRCQECGVPREVVSVWAGHVADRTMTSSVYTHFSDDFMKNEAKKVDYYNRLGVLSQDSPKG